MLNLYEILNVSKDDSCEDIKIKCRDTLRQLEIEELFKDFKFIRYRDFEMEKVLNIII